MRFFSSVIASLFFVFLLNGEKGFTKQMTLEERRSENSKIQEAIRLTQLSNKEPSSSESPRANRVAMNRYRNQHPPLVPKTVYRFPVKPPFRSSYKRFFGGIPR